MAKKTKIEKAALDVSQTTIRNIKEDFERTEKEIVNKLYFKAPHGTTIGGHREKIWGKMFKQIIPRKFVVAHSVFIIDSVGNVSKEVDLAIFDEIYTPYIFKYKKLKFIPIEAVSVVIECKSTSMNQEKLENWANSIKSLETSKRSRVRTIYKIVKGEDISIPTQTATRPLRILCCLNNNNIANTALGEDDRMFDVVIRANDDEGKLHIELDEQKKNLYDWFISLNHAAGLEECEEDHRDDWEKAVGGIKLDDYRVHHKGRELSLLTFNLQLNQLLMLINNPMLFPHIAYAEMFDRNGNEEESKDE